MLLDKQYKPLNNVWRLIVFAPFLIIKSPKQSLGDLLFLLRFLLLFLLFLFLFFFSLDSIVTFTLCKALKYDFDPIYHKAENFRTN
jgi:hypothetical protein